MAKVEKEKFKCRNCGETKEVNGINFFKSYSEIDVTGYTSVCKECAYKIFNDYIKNGRSHRESTKELCKILDKPFIESIYRNTLEQTSNKPDTFLGIYFRNVHMPQNIEKGINTFSHSIYTEQDVSNPKPNTIDETDVCDETLIYSHEWRGKYTKDDIKSLDEYYRDLNNDFNIITTNHKDYAKKIAKASLAMDKAYEDMLMGKSGSDKRYKDLKDTFDTLSKSAQFSENARGANEAGITGISQVVDKIESKQWIYSKEEYEEDALDILLKQFSNIEKSL